ncbi:MAG: AAA family ATPase [Oscillatoria sp. SIO1A7]|nr:AAA family ATPase [Oscillatoria sp. SIO1A7]
MAPPIVKRYSIAFEKYKWFGLAAFILILGASGFVAISTEDPKTTYNSRGFLNYASQPATFSETSRQILEQGRNLGKDVLLADNVIELLAKEIGSQPREVARQVTVRPTGEGEQPGLKLYYDRGETAEKAQKAMALLAQTMIEQSKLINETRLKLVIENNEKRLIQAQEQLKEVQDELEKYLLDNGAAIVAVQSGNLLVAIGESQNQQRQIRLGLEGVDAQIRSWEARLGLTADEAYVSQALSADPIIAQLRAALNQVETQIEFLSKDFRPAHPQMIELRKQQESYDELIQKRAAEVIGGNNVAAPLLNSTKIRQDSNLDLARQQMAQTLIALKTERDSLQQQLNTVIKSERELMQQYRDSPNLQVEQEKLQQRVAFYQDLTQKIQGALEDAKLARTEIASSLRPGAPSYISEQVPESQNPILTLVLGGLSGIGVGGALILILSFLEGKFYTMEEVRGALQGQDVRILGVLPEVWNSLEERDKMPLILDPHSPYLEYYELLRTRLLRLGERPPKVLLFTSVGRGEGKSFCSYNLAIAAARAGKRALILEADLRSPSEARSLNLATDTESIVEPLQYYGQLSHSIRLVPQVENLYILPSPGPLKNSAAVLESSEMHRLLENVSRRFDLVIVDSPALSRCNDALALEPYSDGIIIVTRPGYTQGGLLTEYVVPLREDEDTQLLGAVVNGADLSVEQPDEEEEELAFFEVPRSDIPPELQPSEIGDRNSSAELPTRISRKF